MARLIANERVKVVWYDGLDAFANYTAYAANVTLPRSSPCRIAASMPIPAAANITSSATSVLSRERAA